MSNSTQSSYSLPPVRSGPLITGAALVVAGSLLIAAGFIVGSIHLVSVTRQWVREMEVPPSELAKVKWAQARAAVTAGAGAWQSGNSAQRVGSS
jgi:UPF0716 family protein affecting phage T7 exclusion